MPNLDFQYRLQRQGRIDLGTDALERIQTVEPTGEHGNRVQPQVDAPGASRRYYDVAVVVDDVAEDVPVRELAGTDMVSGRA